ncbi:MAG: hypothetical protein M3N26_09075 [Pseudomonadota bacterium]|nr:hypothetical protein [Pseudomonadota bacterium]
MSTIISRVCVMLPAFTIATLCLSLGPSLSHACEAAAPVFVDGPMDPTVDEDIETELMMRSAKTPSLPSAGLQQTELLCASGNKVRHLTTGLAWTAPAESVDGQGSETPVTQSEQKGSPCDD